MKAEELIRRICQLGISVEQGDCLEELGKFIEKLTAERDAAIADIRCLPENCLFCKYVDENDVTKCSPPEPCCVDGNPDRWEWRGVKNDK